MATKTKIEKLLNMLAGGKGFTARQITARTGLQSPSSAVRTLRENGYRVFTNPRRNSQGKRVFQYRMAA